MQAERQALGAGALIIELGDPASAKATSVLTPRELDVLGLVAQGLSNAQIAQRLVLSEHTVHRHLANILHKLGLSSRAAAAAWLTSAGLGHDVSWPASAASSASHPAPRPRPGRTYGPV